MECNNLRLSLFFEIINNKVGHQFLIVKQVWCLVWDGSEVWMQTLKKTKIIKTLPLLSAFIIGHPPTTSLQLHSYKLFPFSLLSAITYHIQTNFFFPPLCFCHKRNQTQKYINNNNHYGQQYHQYQHQCNPHVCISFLSSFLCFANCSLLWILLHGIRGVEEMQLG